VKERAELGLYRFARGAIVLICRLYWRATFAGLEHVPAEGAFVLAPVHRSFIDFGLAAGVTRRRLRFMGKDSLWKYPAFGWVLSALGAFPVHRGGPDREAMRRCMAVIERGEPLVLFPEGTRRSGPVVDDLHEGAAYVALRTGVPIVPVGIGGSERALQKGKRLPRPVKVHVLVGPPIHPPSTEPGVRVSRRVVHQLTTELRDEVQRLFDLAQARAGVNRREHNDGQPVR
jgi:1-acyl-sn-glycerol-3-phosphate acyltransferase